MHINENWKLSLKLGACLSLLLYKCSLINLISEETSSLSRFAQSVDDSLKLKDLEKCLSLQKNTIKVDARVKTSFNNSVDSSINGSINIGEHTTFRNTY